MIDDYKADAHPVYAQTITDGIPAKEPVRLIDDAEKRVSLAKLIGEPVVSRKEDGPLTHPRPLPHRP